MSLPFGLLGLATIFWGWQVELLGTGVFLAALLEGRRWAAIRWALTPEHFGRISDVSAVLFLAMAAYAYATSDPSRAFVKLSVWQPLVFAPLAVAQAYSVEGRIHLSALFVFLRKGDHEWSRVTIDLALGFGMLCVLAAGAANVRTPAFYLATLGLAAGALWGAKPEGTSRWAWCALFASAAALGWAGQHGLHGLQGVLERKAAEFVFGNALGDQDPTRVSTALGHIGELKQSDAIVLRVDSEGPPPPLFRVATYNRYGGLRWEARRSPLLAVSRSGQAWDIAPPAPRGRSVDVSMSLAGGQGILALPANAFRLERIDVGWVSKSRLGAVRIEDAAPLVLLRAIHGGRPAVEEGPDAEDFGVPSWHAQTFSRLAADLRLDRRKPSEAIRRVEDWFAKRFTYSTYREAADPGVDPIDEFLLKTRTGHCEHFATSTVLLLRAAGIPARYATGYAVRERSVLEKAWVARGIHAHAWTLAHDGRGWLQVDTTPATWEGIEGERRPWHRPISDAWAWATHRVRRWWWGPEQSLAPAAWFTVVLGLLFLAWRLLRGFTAPERAGGARRGAAPLVVLGADSEFYLVEKAFAARGLGRRPHETVGAWVERLIAARAADASLLRAAARLHARYRFDPAGLDAAAREKLRRSALALADSPLPGR
ncbi:MAG: DUF4129 domain-containing protein [Elusimicrobia bacterium]|nr:DUF4129 domain-containing protein [Elusimicrobiota bacterium]